jgi:hypothetical protein
MICTILSVVLGCVSVAAARDSLWERDTLTGGFGGLNEALEPSGIEFAFSAHKHLPAERRGGTSTSRNQGRWSAATTLK